MSNKKNLDWLVAARGYAMYGVFLGHLMVSYINDGHYQSLIYVGKFLEPMFVPFFAILTGAFYQRGTHTFGGYAKLKFGQRMLPVYFYLLLIIPVYWLVPLPGKSFIDSMKWAPLYIAGIPLLSWPSWFLVALFTSEMLYFFIQPFAKGLWKAVGLAILCYSVGWIYNNYVFYMPAWVGMLGMVWMLQASMVFCAFFLIGSTMKPYLLKMTRWPDWQIVLMGITAGIIAVTAVSFNTFNQPPEGSFFSQFIGGEMIVISTGQYGNYFGFIFSTLGASLFLLCLARLLPVTQFMRSCGDHSLVLLGLNGIFLNLLNIHITAFFKPPHDVIIYTMGYAVILSAISMALCLPIAIWLEKYFPQLTGRPMLVGPLLPAFYKKRADK
jgi:hypothetical protein